MSLLHAILLGIIQGLTEFIPVSSTAHLVMSEKLFRLNERLTPQQLTAFNAMIQLGTLVAVLIYFASDLRAITVGFFEEHVSMLRDRRLPWDSSMNDGARLGWMIVLGTIPIVVIGLGLKHLIEGHLTKNLYVIGGAMIGLALVLVVAEMIGKRQRSMENLGWVDALLVGCAQACALIPGSSRSGTTITGCLFLGMTRETAARFSFLLSIPAVFAAAALEFLSEYHHLTRDMLVGVIIATVVSGISGYVAIAFLLHYLKSHSTAVFISYRLILGTIIFFLLATHKISPN